MNSIGTTSKKVNLHNHRILLSLHIVSTVSILGTDLVLFVLGIAGLNDMNPLAIYPPAHLVSLYVIAPLAVIALLTGLLLTFLTPWRLFRYWWVTTKFAITVFFVPIVLFILVPRLSALSSAVMASPSSPLSIHQRLPLVIAPALVSSLLVFNVFLAIFKPAKRQRKGEA